MRFQSQSQQRYAYKDDFFSGSGGMATSSKSSSSIKQSSSKPSSAFLEKDYLGMIDFCLRPSDSALSDISRSKVLNELSNLVFRSLMIGYHPAVDNVVKQLDEFRKEVSDAACTLREDDKRILGESKRLDDISTEEAGAAGNKNVIVSVYDEDDSSEMTSSSSNSKRQNDVRTSTISSFSSSSSSSSSSSLLSRRLMNNKNPSTIGTSTSENDREYYSAACSIDEQKAIEYINKLEKLLTTGETDDSIQGGIYDRGYKRLLTVLKDAGCVFYTDKAFVSATTPYPSGPSSATTSRRPRPTNSNICLSIVDLQLPAKRTKTKDLNLISNCVSRAMLYGTRSDKSFLADALESMIPEFVFEWCEGNETSQEVLYLRALAMLLRESLSSVEAAVTFSGPPSSNTFGFSNISAGVTSFIGTNTAWVDRTEDVSRSGGSSTSSSTLSRPNLRLHDAYLNAFQRVVEMCLTEIGTRAGRNLPQNEDILYNFLNWEKELRINLTAPAWRSNPSELVGEWELMDVLGDGALGPIMTADNFFGMGVGVMVELKMDGSVEVKKLATGSGQSWEFTPGPAHLDTCAFSVASSAKPNLLLKYVGFIDRGQRIESRFSRQPIRMTGRVVSVVNGEPCGSCRFIMMKKRTKELMRIVRTPKVMNDVSNR